MVALLIFYEYDEQIIRILVYTSVRQSDDKRPPSKATQRRDGVSRRRAWARRTIFSTENKNSCRGVNGYFQYQKEKQLLPNLNCHSEDAYFQYQKEKQLIVKQQDCCSIILSVCESYLLAYQFFSALKREEKELKNLLLIFETLH